MVEEANIHPYSGGKARDGSKLWIVSENRLTIILVEHAARSADMVTFNVSVLFQINQDDIMYGV